jgi:hypothetical protein
MTTRFLSLSLGLGFCLYSSPVITGDELPETPAEIQDSWSSIFYCQDIYQEPEVKGRVYPGDLQSCDKADKLIRWSISSLYSPQNRQILEQNARNKSGAIRYNTRSLHEAVTACRQQCRQFSSIYDQKVESGEISQADMR